MTRAAAKPPLSLSPSLPPSLPHSKPPTGACAPLQPGETTRGIIQDHQFPPTAGALKIPIEKDGEGGERGGGGGGGER